MCSSDLTRLDRLVEEGEQAVDEDVRPAEGRDPEIGIGGGAHRIVDLRDDPLRPEVLDGDLGRHDVAVVALGEREEDVGILGTGAAEDVLVGAIAPDRAATEVGREPVEGATVLVRCVVKVHARLLRVADGTEAYAADFRYTSEPRTPADRKSTRLNSSHT